MKIGLEVSSEERNILRLGLGNGENETSEKNIILQESVVIARLTKLLLDSIAKFKGLSNEL